MKSCVTPAGTSTSLTSRINGKKTHTHTHTQHNFARRERECVSLDSLSQNDLCWELLQDKNRVSGTNSSRIARGFISQVPCNQLQESDTIDTACADKNTTSSNRLRYCLVSVSHALSCTPQVVGVGKERRIRFGRRKREFSLSRQHPLLKLSLGLSTLCRQTLGGMRHRYVIA